jgi:hypothetical protein
VCATTKSRDIHIHFSHNTTSYFFSATTTTKIPSKQYKIKTKKSEPWTYTKIKTHINLFDAGIKSLRATPPAIKFFTEDLKFYCLLLK